MKKTNKKFTTHLLLSLALLAQLTLTAPLAAQTTTTCQVSYSTTLTIPGLASSPFNVVVQGAFNFVFAFSGRRISGTVSCPAPTPTPTPTPEPIDPNSGGGVPMD